MVGHVRHLLLRLQNDFRIPRRQISRRLRRSRLSHQQSAKRLRLMPTFHQLHHCWFPWASQRFVKAKPPQNLRFMSVSRCSSRTQRKKSYHGVLILCCALSEMEIIESSHKEAPIWKIMKCCSRWRTMRRTSRFEVRPQQLVQLCTSVSRLTQPVRFAIIRLCRKTTQRIVPPITLIIVKSTSPITSPPFCQ